MLTFADAILLAGIAFMGAIAQLCFKRGANLGRSGHFIRSLLHPWIIIGVVLMAANMLALVWILRRLPLTSVMPATALVYVFVPIGALFFFGERLHIRFWLGALLIVVGIAVIAV
jgi:drug/metabolite transporter (DMT)-like permease